MPIAMGVVALVNSGQAAYKGIEGKKLRKKAACWLNGEGAEILCSSACTAYPRSTIRCLHCPTIMGSIKTGWIKYRNKQQEIAVVRSVEDGTLYLILFNRTNKSDAHHPCGEVAAADSSKATKKEEKFRGLSVFEINKVTITTPAKDNKANTFVIDIGDLGIKHYYLTLKLQEDETSAPEDAHARVAKFDEHLHQYMQQQQQSCV